MQALAKRSYMQLRPQRAAPKCLAPAPRHQLRQPQPCCRATSADASTSMSALICSCEESGDWLRCFELVTEANALKVELSIEALEATVRTYSQGGQHARAADVFEKLKARSGYVPTPGTVVQVAKALCLSGEEGGVKAQAFLEGVPGSSGPEYVPGWNATVRALAASDKDAALKLLERLVFKQEMPIYTETFHAVALAFMHAGDRDTAEAVIEMRDY